MTLDDGARTITGTPTELQAATAYTWTATDGDGDSAELTFQIAVLDAGLVVSPLALTVPEGGIAYYTVKLRAPPTQTVDIQVELAATPPLNRREGPRFDVEFTFTPDNWNVEQQGSVRLADDDRRDGNQTYLMLLVPSGGEYDSVEAVRMEVTVVEDDVPALVLPPTLSLNEGTAMTYGVRLRAVPSAAVTVTITGASGEVAVDTDSNAPGNQNTLSFSTTDWKTAKTVTVSAGHDADTDDDAATLTHTASGPAEYVGVTGDTAVTVHDDDGPGATISGSPLSVNEGSSATYSVVLDAQPTHDVTIAITRKSGDADLTIADTDSMSPGVQNTLTFSAANWSTPGTSPSTPPRTTPTRPTAAPCSATKPPAPTPATARS